MLLCIFLLLKKELLEKKNPYEINPTESYTAGYSYEDTDYKSKKTSFFEPGGPSYNKLNHPVNTGNKEQKKLNKTALFVKPSHYKSSYVCCIG